MFYMKHNSEAILNEFCCYAKTFFAKHVNGSSIWSARGCIQFLGFYIVNLT